MRRPAFPPLGFAWITGLALIVGLGSCGESPTLPRIDGLLRIETETRDIEFGRSFPLRVVRVWRRDHEPAVWDDAVLAPLVVREETTARLEDDVRLQETRTFRAYAFTKEDVTIPAIEMPLRSRADGTVLRVTSTPLHIRVRPTLDAAAPGDPEPPGDPMPERSASTTWLLGLLAAAAAFAGGRWFLRRGTVPSTRRETSPAERALAHLAELRARPTSDPDERAAAVVASSTVLRTYLQDRHGLPTGERTTPEILSLVLGESAPLDAALRGADAVKFAAARPSAHARDTVLDAAVAFVTRDEGGAS